MYWRTRTPHGSQNHMRVRASKDGKQEDRVPCVTWQLISPFIDADRAASDCTVLDVL